MQLNGIKRGFNETVKVLRQQNISFQIPCYDNDSCIKRLSA